MQFKLSRKTRKWSVYMPAAVLICLTLGVTSLSAARRPAPPPPAESPSGGPTTPHPSNKVKIISYNIYMFAGSAGWPATGFGSYDHARARKIVNQIIKDGYDVVLFQELMADDVRNDTIAAMLKERGYYIAQGIENEYSGVKQDSGLFIASKLPIVKLNLENGERKDYVFQEYTECTGIIDQGSNCMAGKGIVGVVLDMSKRWGPGRRLMVFNTHTNTLNYDAKSMKVQASQFDQAKEFIAHNVNRLMHGGLVGSETSAANTSVMVFGDMNVPGNNISLNHSSTNWVTANRPYENMLNNLRGNGSLRDAWKVIHPVINSTADYGFTWDCASLSNCNNDWIKWKEEPARERLDYAFAFDRIPGYIDLSMPVLPVNRSAVDVNRLNIKSARLPIENFRHGDNWAWAFFKWSPNMKDDSDHFPLEVVVQAQ